MSTDGGPERDDYGLPPVDVEVPDDARELDADVQAYRRELRAERRQRRAQRLRRPLRKGLAIPLLAGCLLLALITSVLLVLFTADETGIPKLPPAHPPVSQVTGGPGLLLPDAQVTLGGRTEPVTQLAAHAPSLLTLVPQGCHCASALRHLAGSAAGAHVALYLVGAPGAMSQVTKLAAEAGESPGRVAEDVGNVLPKVYQPSGLTAVLVRTGGLVAYTARDLTQPQPMLALDATLRQFAQAR